MNRCSKEPTPFQALCSVCCRLFGGVSGFDTHRVNGACVDPSNYGYVEVEGVWRQPMDHDKVKMFRTRVSGTRKRT